MEYGWKAKDHWRFQKRDPHSGRWANATLGELLDPSVPTTGLVQMKRTNSKPEGGGVDLPEFDVQANGRSLGTVYARTSRESRSHTSGSVKLWHYRKPGGRTSSGMASQKDARNALLQDIGHENQSPSQLGSISDFDFDPVNDLSLERSNLRNVGSSPTNVGTIGAALPAAVENAENKYNEYASQAEDAPHKWGEPEEIRLSEMQRDLWDAYEAAGVPDDDRMAGFESKYGRPELFTGFEPIARQGYDELGPGPGPGQSMAESAGSHRVDYRVDGMGEVISSYESGSLDEIRGRFEEMGFQIVGSSPVAGGPGSDLGRGKPTFTVSAPGQGIVEEHDSLSEAQRAADFYEGGSVSEVPGPKIMAPGTKVRLTNPGMPGLSNLQGTIVRDNGEEMVTIAFADGTEAERHRDSIRHPVTGKKVTIDHPDPPTGRSAKTATPPAKVVKDWYKDFPGRNYDGSDHDGVEMRISKQPDGSITQIRQVNEDDETYAPVAGAYGVSYNRVDERGVMPGVMVDADTRKVSDPNAKPRWETYGRLSKEQALAVEAAAPEIAEAVAKHAAESQSYGNVARLTIEFNPDGTLTVKGSGHGRREQSWEETVGKPAPPTKSLTLLHLEASLAAVEGKLQRSGMNLQFDEAKASRAFEAGKARRLLALSERAPADPLLTAFVDDLPLSHLESALEEVENELERSGMNIYHDRDKTVKALDMAEKSIHKLDRSKLSDDQFALAEDRRYPIPDVEHAKLALSRAKGTADEAKVKSAVLKRYPELKEYALEALV